MPAPKRWPKHCDRFVGQRILELRLEKGLSQSELSAIVAEAVGYGSSSLVSYIERSERAPGKPIIQTLADFFAVSYDYLAWGESNELDMLLARLRHVMRGLEADQQELVLRFAYLLRDNGLNQRHAEAISSLSRQNVDDADALKSLLERREHLFESLTKLLGELVPTDEPTGSHNSIN